MTINARFLKIGVLLTRESCRNDKVPQERSSAVWLHKKLDSYRHGKFADYQLAKHGAIPEVANMFESSGT